MAFYSRLTDFAFAACYPVCILFYKRLNWTSTPPPHSCFLSPPSRAAWVIKCDNFPRKFPCCHDRARFSLRHCVFLDFGFSLVLINGNLINILELSLQSENSNRKKTQQPDVLISENSRNRN